MISRHPRFFVVGDARTGTTSLHQWLLAADIKSIHYYVREAQQKEPIHKHRRQNWMRLTRFIDESEYQAYSDYPTRMFFRELMEHYPDARFILTRRKDPATWTASMKAYFAGTDLDMSLLESYYTCLNEEIRSYASFYDANFMELCIDDDPQENAKLLTNFLGVRGPLTLGRFNSSNRIAY